MEKRMKLLRYLGRMDAEYGRLQEEYNAWESRFTELVRTLPTEQQDIIWGYVCTSDALDHRLPEIACDTDSQLKTLIQRIEVFDMRII